MCKYIYIYIRIYIYIYIYIYICIGLFTRRMWGRQQMRSVVGIVRNIFILLK